MTGGRGPAPRADILGRVTGTGVYPTNDRSTVPARPVGEA